MPNDFLPISKLEIKDLGWQQPDIVIVSGDAYVDHPAFAPAIIGRWLQACGYKVAILPQPDWNDPKSFTQLGKPRLFFGITSGNMDSMINKYTAQKKLRSKDAYSPDGNTKLRPDRATLVYSQIIHSLYKDVPIVLGGIEASLRRLPHYDFWSDKIRNSILFDSRADYLVYGMGERPIQELADQISKGNAPQNIDGTALIAKVKPDNAITLPAYNKHFSKNDFFSQQTIYRDNHRTQTVYQSFAGRWLKINPPAKPLSTQEIDAVYDLPFQRKPHPVYLDKKISAFEQIKTSVTSHRGCFGGCSFCGIGFHQGKTIQSRSLNSIIKEIRSISNQDDFHGTISDLGGPSANMYGMSCKLNIADSCKRASCLFPDICPHLNTDHHNLANLLKRAARLPDVKHLFVASGIRFDLALTNPEYIKLIAQKHTGGLLKLAPEHKSSKVLQLMRKPEFSLYQDFLKFFRNFSHSAGKNQAVVPYMIIGHPGSNIADTIELAVYLKKENVKLKQIQEFIPLPMTDSAQMYFTQKDLNGNPINVPKGREIRLRKALIQWFIPQNKKLIIEALRNANRPDLINFFLNNKN